MAGSAAGRRLILAAAVAGLIVRLAFGLLYWVHKPLTHDEREYLALAQSVAAGRGFVYDASHDTGTAQQFGRAPGVSAVPGDRRRRIGRARRRAGAREGRAGDRRRDRRGAHRASREARWPETAAGVAAAAIAAVYPPLVWICAYVLSEALYSTLALLTALLLDAALDRTADVRTEARSAPGRLQPVRGGRAIAAAAGLTAGLAVLVRPAMLVFLPLAALWLISQRRTALAAVLVVTSIAAIAPWTVRNMRVYGTIRAGCVGGGRDVLDRQPSAGARRRGSRGQPRHQARGALRSGARTPGSPRKQLEPLYYREALQYIARHPVWWLGLLAKKAFYTVVPIGPSYTLHSTRYLVSSVASYLLLLPLAAVGARAWWRGGRRPEALFLLAASARDRRSRIFSPGAVPDSRHRSGPDRVRGASPARSA